MRGFFYLISMFQVNHLSGIKLNVCAYSAEATYGALLEGEPNNRINNLVINDVDYPHNWGDRKHFMIPPAEQELAAELKPIVYSAWLKSFEPTNPEYHGSELVVTWFDDHHKGKTVQQIFQMALESINWNGLAQDFYV